MQTCYFNVDSRWPDKKILEKAAAIVKAGGLAAFPTETVYGLGASAFSRSAVLRLYAVKERPLNQPFLLHISCLEQLQGIVELDREAAALAERYWPGPLSLIVPGARGVAAEMLDSQGRIGLRFPSHPVARDFISLTGPLAATSANLHGAASPRDAAGASRDLDGLIEAVVVAEEGITGVDSTIIDMSSRPGVMVREGELGWRELETAWPGLIIKKG